MSSRRRRLSAHPRSRGEHFYINDVTWQRIGSSPLTRGAHPVCGVLAKQLRLIPAHAGSTARRYGLGMKSPAHPRSRGEHSIWLIATPHGVGSSPLTRGALIDREPAHAIGGLIPAHAGSTIYAHSELLRQRAHPRSRGEHYEPELVASMPDGSSPLTRGAPGVPGLSRAQKGLIPAHAGSTTTTAPRSSRAGARPRSRGEHGDEMRALFQRLGSSPLTRGAPRRGA